jgi:hypothetical protein
MTACDGTPSRDSSPTGIDSMIANLSDTLVHRRTRALVHGIDVAGPQPREGSTDRDESGRTRFRCLDEGAERGDVGARLTQLCPCMTTSHSAGSSAGGEGSMYEPT